MYKLAHQYLILILLYLLLEMSITAPHDAHTKLVLQVYLGSLKHIRVQCYTYR